MRSINALIVYLVIVHCGSHKNDADALSLLPEFYDSFSHNSIASQCLKITQNVAFHNSILAFSTNFWSYYKVTCLVTLFGCHFQLCKHSPNWTIFVHLNLVLNGTFWEIFKHCDSGAMRMCDQQIYSPFLSDEVLGTQSLEQQLSVVEE